LRDDELEFVVLSVLLDVDKSPADSVLRISDGAVASMLASARGVLAESVQNIAPGV